MSSKVKKIAVFTGNRAEYGLQYPILKAIKDHPLLDYKLIISGAHLDENFGSTIEEINNDGFEIHAEAKIEMDADSIQSNVQAIGSGILSIGRILGDLKPDLMIVYADRFEGLAAVIASSQMNIPTAHIEGGDITEGGALDDSVRHAMSKLSHIHFTTNEQATNRILAMGEEKWRVHTVGFPAIDLIKENNYATEKELIKKLGLNLTKPVVIFTQHSVTTESNESSSQVSYSIKALKKLAKEGVQIIVTYPNNDSGAKQIIKNIKHLQDQKIENIQVHKSLGRYIYHGLLALSRNNKNRIACVGNSSSGIKETPIFGCPTVNIGSRQSGRLRGQNVLDSDYDSNTIYEAITKCLFDDDFRKNCTETDNPYYIGDAGTKIAKILANLSINKELLRKKMTLLGEIKNGWYR